MIANSLNVETKLSSAPEFVGTCGYSIQHNYITIDAFCINNPRDAGDLSGTLSVEIWALKQAYMGGEFEGVALAGTCIGELKGQHFLTNCHYELLFQEPPAGTWQLTLMLREWTENGFITRDHVNFDLPYTVELMGNVQKINDNVISVDFTKTDSDAKKLVEDTSTKRNTTPASTEKPKQKVTPEEKTGLISLNDASAEEIARLKGITQKLATSIVAGRPYTDINQLRSIKGLGPKTLKVILPLVKL